MGQIEQQARRSAAEHPGPHHPQNEGGAGVVAEGQQPLGLGAGALSALIQGDGGAGPHRVAPDEAQSHGGGAGPVHPEEGGHHRLEQPPQTAGHPQLHHQGGQHEEGKEGGQDDVAAEGEAILHGGHGLPGPEDQGQGGAQKPQGETQVPDVLFSQKTSHPAHLLFLRIASAGILYARRRENLPVRQKNAPARLCWQTAPGRDGG